MSHLDYFFYAGSQNQMQALQPTFQALVRQNARARFFVEGSVYSLLLSQSGFSPVTYTLSDIARSTLTMLQRAPGLKRKLLEQEMAPAMLENSIRFASAYAYVPYFLRILAKTQPAYVLVSNDHNVANRALIAVARYLKIETVYMQHASVSKYFPALRFNYAFLDGKASLETYRACELADKKPSPLYPVPNVFLSGQKKALRKCGISHRQTKLGIAINTLDGLGDFLELTKELTDAGFDVCIRWHPAQASDYVAKLKTSLRDKTTVTYNDPKSSNVSDFLCSCFAIIASNTSIHLEAVLSSVPSFYYEISSLSTPDVYGYVQNGLVTQVESRRELIAYLKDIAGGISIPENLPAIRFYSTSYGTVWEGREGELVAATLENIRHGRTVEGLYFKENDLSNFAAVYAVK